MPAAGHTALEISAFTFVTFVVGGFGAAPLAAHNACLMMAAFTFMFPLGFGSAAAVRVGTFIGGGPPRHARVAGWLAHWLEQVQNNRIYRPEQIYVGKRDVPYEPLETSALFEPVPVHWFAGLLSEDGLERAPTAGK